MYSMEDYSNFVFEDLFSYKYRIYKYLNINYSKIFKDSIKIYSLRKNKKEDLKLITNSEFNDMSLYSLVIFFNEFFTVIGKSKSALRIDFYYKKSNKENLTVLLTNINYENDIIINRKVTVIKGTFDKSMYSVDCHIYSFLKEHEIL